MLLLNEIVNTRMIDFKESQGSVSDEKREKVFFEHLYNSIPAAIVITSTSGIISMINREFTNLFGFTSEEAVNNNINDLVVPDDLNLINS